MAWIAAGWAYRAAVRCAKPYLDVSINAALLSEIDDQEHGALEFLDLSNTTQAQYQDVVQAFHHGLESEIRRGPWRDQEFFAGFVNKTRELCRLLDDRSSRPWTAR